MMHMVRFPRRFYFMALNQNMFFSFVPVFSTVGYAMEGLNSDPNHQASNRA